MTRVLEDDCRAHPDGPPRIPRPWGLKEAFGIGTYSLPRVANTLERGAKGRPFPFSDATKSLQ